MTKTTIRNSADGKRTATIEERWPFRESLPGERSYSLKLITRGRSTTRIVEGPVKTKREASRQAIAFVRGAVGRSRR